MNKLSFKQTLLACAFWGGLSSDSAFCNIKQCGCDDGGYDAAWCTADNAMMRSDWCHQSSTNCENCWGTWCEPSDPEWGYDNGIGPDDWGSLYADCNGAEQSPINIPVTSTPSAQKTGAVAAPFVPGSPTDFTVTQSHGAPKYSCATAGTCGTLTHDSVPYDLLQFHFHTPSEHTIDGKYYPIAMHMVHGASGGGYSVLGVVFEGTIAEGATDCGVCDEFDKLFTSIGDENGEVRSNVDMSLFADGSMGHYQYDGSFTTPPCTEGVNWYVQAKVIGIKQSQIDTYWQHIGGFPGNARDPQPLNARTITYNIDAP